MFGFNAIYRGKYIFAVLPRTRGVVEPQLSLPSNWRAPDPVVLARLIKDP